MTPSQLQQKFKMFEDKVLQELKDYHQRVAASHASESALIQREIKRRKKCDTE